MPFIAAGLALLPQLISLGMDVVPLIQRMIGVANGADPTDADWAALHAVEDSLRARLNDKSKDT